MLRDEIYCYANFIWSAARPGIIRPGIEIIPKDSATRTWDARTKQTRFEILYVARNWRYPSQSFYTRRNFGANRRPFEALIGSTARRRTVISF
jgi:hypothetical protein